MPAPLRMFRLWSLPEWRHHPGRHALAVAAVAIGVALGFAVHLINTSALDEFSAAVRSVNGQADFELRAARGGIDEALYARVAAHPQVALASPVVEVDTYAINDTGQRVPLRVLGIDALVAAAVATDLMPRPDVNANADAGTDTRAALFDPDALYLNPGAQQKLGRASTVKLQTGTERIALTVRGSVATAGPPLAVMDIAGAQQRFGRLGQLTRIDVRLRSGAERTAVLRELAAQDIREGTALMANVRAEVPEAAAQRVSNLSRAYRVNLTVLALVALFTGGFLVFSVLSLAVAQRTPQLALLGVLGATPQQRLGWVLAEAALLGSLGSLLGLALGTALAWSALTVLSGDLGGGYFPGVAPRLQWSTAAALTYTLLGLATALAGAWLPARTAQRMAPAQALKGLGGSDEVQASHTLSGPSTHRHRRVQAAWRRAQPWLGPALLLAGAGLALLPPISGLPWAAYLSVAALLVGGIACVPAGLSALLSARLLPLAPQPRQHNAALIPGLRHPLAWIAVERAREQRHAATIAVAGVVASLSLAVALTVMVTSFRGAVTQWLDQVLPADLYARTALSGNAADAVYLPPTFAPAAAQLPGVLRVEALRLSQLVLDDTRPAVALIARPLDEPEKKLPLVGELLPAQAVAHGTVPVYVSEAMVSLYGLSPGTRFVLPMQRSLSGKVGNVETDPRIEATVRGVWRDYARQHGAVAMDRNDYVRLTGDDRVNDLALWLAPGTDVAAVQRALRTLAGDNALIDFATPAEIRALSLRIFDRSFAVTTWLQVVAIAIGLAGVAASFSAQVLARRKEFGLLAHLGFTPTQVLGVVAAEGAVWTAAGAAIGLALGLAVSVVLVHVVNPQSFHWTMELQLPWARLLALCAAVVVAGTVTATLAARRATGRGMALAVKEDW